MAIGRCHSVGCRARLMHEHKGRKILLTLTLAKALEIALSDNPTIKVAEEEIAFKKVTRKETWQNLLPQASIDLREAYHHGSAVQYRRPDVKMGKDKANTATGVR